MRVRPVRAGAANWLGSGGQGRRLGARHLGRRPTQDEDVDALEAIKLDERLDQGAGCGLPSSTQRSDHELADQLDAVIAASLADAPSTRKSLPQPCARRSDYDLDAAIAASLTLAIAT